MKKIFLILLFASQLFATNWYVDGALTTGSNNGTSWANAWKTFSAISWASVHAGDIVYISGGTDSTVYNSALTVGADGAPPYNYITIRKGLTAGHNGRVVIRQATENHTGTGIALNGRDYIHVIGLESHGWWKCIDSDGRSNVHLIDSCKFTNGNWTVGTCTSGNPSDSLIYRWCYVNANWNTTTQTDAFGGTDCTWLEVRNCTIIQGSKYSAIPHSDIMQNRIAGHQLYYNSWFESLPNYDSSAATGLNGQQDLANDTTLFYNCVMITRGWTYGMFMDQANTNHTWIMVNNTFIKDYNCTDAGTIQTQQVETFAYNNIFYSTNSTNTNFNLAATLSPSNANFDYNLWYQPNNPTEVVNWGTFANWQSQGGDVNSPNPANPLFTYFNSTPCTSQTGYDTNMDFTIQAGSPCINAGTANPKALIESWGLPWTDYNGNARDESTPTIGAYEFVTGIADTTATVSFTSVTNANLNSYHIASGVLSGADSTFHIYTATSDSFKVGALGSYNVIEVEAENGDTVYISNTASGSYSTPTVSSIKVSGTTRSFTVTTKSAPGSPSGTIGKFSNGKIIYDSTGKIIYMRTQ